MHSNDRAIQLTHLKNNSLHIIPPHYQHVRKHYLFDCNRRSGRSLLLNFVNADAKFAPLGA